MKKAIWFQDQKPIYQTGPWWAFVLFSIGEAIGQWGWKLAFWAEGHTNRA